VLAVAQRHAAAARAAAQSTNLELVRQKHLVVAQAWKNVASQRQFTEKKQAERQAATTQLNRKASPLGERVRR
jgi:hypothetical protein